MHGTHPTAEVQLPLVPSHLSGTSASCLPCTTSTGVLFSRTALARRATTRSLAATQDTQSGGGEREVMAEKVD